MAARIGGAARHWRPPTRGLVSPAPPSLPGVSRPSLSPPARAAAFCADILQFVERPVFPTLWSAVSIIRLHDSPESRLSGARVEAAGSDHDLPSRARFVTTRARAFAEIVLAKAFAGRLPNAGSFWRSARHKGSACSMSAAALVYRQRCWRGKLPRFILPPSLRRASLHWRQTGDLKPPDAALPAGMIYASGDIAAIARSPVSISTGSFSLSADAPARKRRFRKSVMLARFSRPCPPLPMRRRPSASSLTSLARPICPASNCSLAACSSARERLTQLIASGIPYPRSRLPRSMAVIRPLIGASA